MITDINQDISFGTKLKAYFQILKFRLSAVVAFSAGIGFLLASDTVSYLNLALIVLSGFMVTGGANIINQIKEIEYDRLMKRTQSRPLPMKVLSVEEAGIWALILSVLGLGIQLSFLNHLTAGLSILSLVLYGFVYTPLKRVGSIAVWVGALPGALPVLIGWTAVTDKIIPDSSTGAWLGVIVFAIQVVWQLPHFWAIAWVGDEDYTNAGFRLLLNKGLKNKKTAFFIFLSNIALLVISMLPVYLGMLSTVVSVIVIIAGVLFALQSVLLIRNCDRKSALMLMFGSLLYLPIIQVALVVGKL